MVFCLACQLFVFLYVALLVGWWAFWDGCCLVGWLMCFSLVCLIACLLDSFFFGWLAGWVVRLLWLASRQLAGRLACLTGGDDLYPISKSKYVRIMA